MTDQNSGDERGNHGSDEASGAPRPGDQPAAPYGTPSSAPGGYDPRTTHRFDDREDTRAVPPQTTVLPPPPPGGYGTPPRRDQSRTRSRTAGLLVAALLVGTAGGVAGA